ncbi:carbohydrate-binding protein [uncultured Deefgea sp.]|uniref:carbohydrate-binding protein n=1 Tax=uncultured Deefgea sp. TaxID=1304914 RepID=UPI00261CEC12|nr:carbohydrate-binding protein [uncultured Deefgea sp.]
MSLKTKALFPLLLVLATSAWASSPWREGRHYSQGEIVRYQGQTYKARQGHQAERGANWNPEAAASLWAPVERRNNGRFGWQEGKYYSKGQIVNYQGRSYRVRQGHKAERGANWNPTAAPSLWEALDGDLNWR